MTANLNEDPSSCKHQLDSTIQEIGKGSEKEEVKSIEIEGVEEWEVEKILNKRKIKEIDKYLMQWKKFTAESDIWEKEKDLENAKELVNEFKERLEIEVRRQEGIKEKQKVKLNPRADEFKRSELLEKYMAKLLFGQDDKNFKDEYLKKLEKNWQR